MARGAELGDIAVDRPAIAEMPVDEPAQAPRVLREWRRVPGLWQGGGEDSWLFAYVIPAGVHGLTEAGVLDVQRLVDDWMTDTRDPSVEDC